MFSKTIRLAWILGALALVSSAVALGAAGGNKASTSSITMIPMSASTFTSDESAAPRYSEAVTFEVFTDAVKQPFVHLKCWQGGSLVLESWQAWFFGAAGTQEFRLGPTPAWQSGAADCTAFLENWDSYHRNGRTPVLASTSFHVDA
jgi:hypothetical protein